MATAVTVVAAVMANMNPSCETNPTEVETDPMAVM